MLIRHKLVSIIEADDASTGANAFESAHELLSLFLGFLEELDLFKDLTEVTDDNRLDLVDRLDSLVMEKEIAIENYADASLSIYPSINYYLKNIMLLARAVSNKASEHFDLGLLLTDEDIKWFEKNVKEVISGLVYTLWIEFGAQTLYYDLSEGKTLEDARLNACIFLYSKKYNLDPNSIVERISDLRQIYKLQLRFFDEYPELESQFELIMGPFANYVDESKLTLELVNKLLEGEIKPDDLLTSEFFSEFGSTDTIEDSVLNLSKSSGFSSNR